RVFTVPSGVTLLMDTESLAKTVPSEETATEPRLLNRAIILFPSAKPSFPGEPQRVDTFPSAILILRMVRFPESATKRVPSFEDAIPVGFLNLAKEPFPSLDPASPAEPQRVDTVPS